MTIGSGINFQLHYFFMKFQEMLFKYKFRFIHQTIVKENLYLIFLIVLKCLLFLENFFLIFDVINLVTSIIGNFKC